MTAREHEASSHHERFAYLSEERSDRTGGHLWTERVVETEQGCVRLLLAEDGKPLSPDRAREERAKLSDAIAHPDEFARRQQAAKGDDLRGRLLLDKLPDGFLIENARLEHGVWHMDFRPDPAYSPAGIEDRVMHSMTGSLAIDARQLRLIHLDGHLEDGVNIGYGLLATLRAGSNFALDKQEFEGTWRPVHVVADFQGKALLFKDINRRTEYSRSEFRHLNPGITIVQAVSMAEHGGRTEPPGFGIAQLQKGR
ncbi:MAG TPA: hypothetical protein VGN16_18900 [Acidobacteriaceae bacterium]|jgi:hypothetical protein